MKQNKHRLEMFFDKTVLNRPVLTLLSVFLVIALLGYHIRDFEVDASSETLTLENDEDLRYSRIISDRYDKQDFLLLTYTPRHADLFSPTSMKSLADLENDLSAIDHVADVISLRDMPVLLIDAVSLDDLTAGPPRLADGSITLSQARREFEINPLYRNLMVSPDLHSAVVQIKFPSDTAYRRALARLRQLERQVTGGKKSAEKKQIVLKQERRVARLRDALSRQRQQVVTAVRSVMEKYADQAELFLGGASMIAYDLKRFIRHDLVVYGTAVFLFIILGLWTIFREIRWVVLPLLVCVLSVIAMIGLLGWQGWAVTVISSNFVSLQLIFTMAVVIHLIVRYREKLNDGIERSHRRLVRETVSTMARPCLYAGLTTMAGFGSLLLAGIRPVKTFGWMMMLGVTISLLVTFFVFPAILVLLEKSSPESRAQDRAHPVTVRLAGLTENHGGAVVLVSTLLFVFFAVGVTRLDVENSFIDYFKKDTEIYRGMRFIDRHLGGTIPLDVLVNLGTDKGRATGQTASAGNAEKVTTDSDFDMFQEFDQAPDQAKYWFTPDRMDRLKRIHDYLDGLPATGKVLSLASFLKIIQQKNEGKPLDTVELSLLYTKLPEAYKSLIVDPYVSMDHQQARFAVRIVDSRKNLNRNRLLTVIRSHLNKSFGYSADRFRLAGLLVLYNNILQNLFGSQILSLGAVVLIVGMMFLLLFRSFTIGSIALAVNALPVVIVLGLMGWLNIPLDIMTITIAAICVGIAVDDTIHYLYRFRAEFAENPHYIQCMHRTHGSVAFALFYTTATITVGFSILTLSSFIPSIYFGLFTGLAMTAAFITDLTLLPRLLILTKPFGPEPTWGRG